jgi:hypothetical protein
VNGIEHYKKAEEALGYAAEGKFGSDEERYNLAVAQVHATLALAAATAPTIVPPSEDGAAWDSAIRSETPR